MEPDRRCSYPPDPPDESSLAPVIFFSVFFYNSIKAR